jgi:hypothetical protein
VPERPALSRPAVLVAILVLAGFALFVVFLVAHVDEDDVEWTRLAWVFASVEAIAFGAAGALFGSSIQRERAEKAEASAKENADAAANGRALASALKAEDPGAAEGAGGLEALGPGQARDAAGVAARHAALARELFP